MATPRIKVAFGLIALLIIAAGGLVYQYGRPSADVFTVHQASLACDQIPYPPMGNQDTRYISSFTMNDQTDPLTLTAGEVVRAAIQPAGENFSKIELEVSSSADKIIDWGPRKLEGVTVRANDANQPSAVIWEKANNSALLGASGPYFLVYRPASTEGNMGLEWRQVTASLTTDQGTGTAWREILVKPASSDLKLELATPDKLVITTTRTGVVTLKITGAEIGSSRWPSITTTGVIMSAGVPLELPIVSHGGPLFVAATQTLSCGQKLTATVGQDPASSKTETPSAALSPVATPAPTGTETATIQASNPATPAPTTAVPSSSPASTVTSFSPTPTQTASVSSSVPPKSPLPTTTSVVDDSADDAEQTAQVVDVASEVRNQTVTTAVREVKVDDTPVELAGPVQVTQGQPLFVGVLEGTAQPGEIVTVTVYSEPKSYTVTADQTGHWSLEIPTDDLEPGEHRIEYQTASTAPTELMTFTVAQAAESTPASSKSVTPISTPAVPLTSEVQTSSALEAALALLPMWAWLLLGIAVITALVYAHLHHRKLLAHNLHEPADWQTEALRSSRVSAGKMQNDAPPSRN